MLVWFFCSVLTYLFAFYAGEEIDSFGVPFRRVVKGFKVDINVFPYAVFLYFDVSRPSTCGSSLITSKIVITSAHCLREMVVPGGRVHAYLGATIPIHAKVVRNVTKFKIHPKYNQDTGGNDLGLAMLHKEVPMHRGIHKIPLYKKSVEVNETLYTVGWGKQWPNVLPDISDERQLTASKQRIISDKECLIATGIKISGSHLCSLPVVGYHYRGDMGNGLVTTKPSLALVAVVTFMKGEATLYANLFNERRWLRETCLELYGRKLINLESERKWIDSNSFGC